ncbi:MAG: NUDIX domain-containing protein [Terrimonas sp.]|nr:NUDIX domain-containing protein [Terrimonas sp.]
MEKVNPWTINDQHQVYENPWIRVTEFDVLNPAGGKGIYGKVHFKHIAIGILPLDEDYNTYLVGQYRFTLDQYSWEIPEGGGALGVPPLDSAKRELKEETGLEAAYWENILTMHLSNSCSDEISEIFLARHLSQGASMPEETEQLTVKKLSFEEAYQMVIKKEITDAISVAAILQVKLMMLDGRIS